MNKFLAEKALEALDNIAPYVPSEKKESHRLGLDAYSRQVLWGIQPSKYAHKSISPEMAAFLLTVKITPKFDSLSFTYLPRDITVSIPASNIAPSTCIISFWKLYNALGQMDFSTPVLMEGDTRTVSRYELTNFWTKEYQEIYKFGVPCISLYQQGNKNLFYAFPEPDTMRLKHDYQYIAYLAEGDKFSTLDGCYEHLIIALDKASDEALYDSDPSVTVDYTPDKVISWKRDKFKGSYRSRRGKVLKAHGGQLPEFWAELITKIKDSLPEYLQELVY